MKFSLVHNDKSTFWDEVVLALISFVCILTGVLLIVYRPGFWVISESMMIVAGAMLTMTGVMFLPCLIYRLFTNEIK